MKATAAIAMRLYLAIVWLIVPYPYGLWLFAISALGLRHRLTNNHTKPQYLF